MINQHNSAHLGMTSYQLHQFYGENHDVYWFHHHFHPFSHGFQTSHRPQEALPVPRWHDATESRLRRWAPAEAPAEAEVLPLGAVRGVRYTARGKRP
jgi:hypothetical protein